MSSVVRLMGQLGNPVYSRVDMKFHNTIAIYIVNSQYFQ